MRYSAYRLAGAEALDLSQTVIAIALDRVDNMRGDDICAWLRGILRYVHLSNLQDRIDWRSRICPIEDYDWKLTTDDAKSLESRLYSGQCRAIAEDHMTVMQPHYSEILQRFYFERQSPATIMAEMGLTFTQFRLLKSRAKMLLTKSITASRKQLAA